MPRLVIEIESGDHAGSALPYGGFFVGHGLIGGGRLGRPHGDIGLLLVIVDEIVTEPQGIGTGGHTFDDVVSIRVGDGEMGGIVHPNQHVPDGLAVRRVGHGAGDPPAGRYLQLHRTHTGCQPGGDVDAGGIVLGHVALVNKPYAVASHGYLSDGEAAVDVGVPDVIGPLDQHEGPGVVGFPREPDDPCQVTGGGQVEIKLVGCRGRHRGPALGLIAALLRFHEVVAFLEVGQHVYAFGVGHGGVGVAGKVFGGLERF